MVVLNSVCDMRGLALLLLEIEAASLDGPDMGGPAAPVISTSSSSESSTSKYRVLSGALSHLTRGPEGLDEFWREVGP